MTLWLKTSCSHCVHMGPHDMFSNEWYAHERGGTERPATVDDIRAGVESGTIKGEVVTLYDSEWDGQWFGNEKREWVDVPEGRYLLIPVSDGGIGT